MKHSKALLGLAVTAAILSGCSNSSSSSKAAEPLKPIPVIPITPEPIVLTDAQKLELGKMLVKRLDGQAKNLIAGGSQAVKKLLVLSDKDKDEKISSSEAEELLVRGVETTLISLKDISDSLESLYEKLASKEITYGAKLPFETDNKGLVGTVIITNEEGVTTFDFSLAVETTEDMGSRPTGDLNVKIAQQGQVFKSSESDDPANWQDTTKVDGVFVADSNGMKTAFENLVITQIYVLDDENLAKAKARTDYGYKAIKQASLKANKVTVEENSVIVTAGLDFLTLKPLVKLDSGELVYENTNGSVKALGNVGEGALGPIPIFAIERVVRSAADNVGLFNKADHFSTDSLNVKHVKAISVTAKVGGAEVNDTFMGDFVFNDSDAELYDTDIKIGGMNEKAILDVANYTFGNEDKKLTLTNDYGMAVYSLSISESDPINKISCEFTPLAISLERYVGLHGYISGEGQARCSSASDITTSKDSIKEWLSSASINQVGVYYPGFPSRVYLTNLDEVTEASSPVSGVLKAEGEKRPSSNHKDNALTFGIDIKGKLELPEQEILPIALNITHNEALNYQLEAKMGAENEEVKVSFGKWNKSVSLSSKVVFSETAFDAVAKVELANIQKLVSESKFSEIYKAELAVDGVVDDAVGEIVVDGLKIADVILYRGNLVVTEENKDLLYRGSSTRPEEIALGIKFTDSETDANKALFSNMALFSNVEKFSYVEKCPEMSPDSSEPPVCQKEFFPAIGVMYEANVTLMNIVKENISPYTFDDVVEILPFFGRE